MKNRMHRFTPPNQPDCFLSYSKAAMQQSNSDLRACNPWLLHRGLLFPDIEKAMERYRVALLHLQAEFLKLISALRQYMPALRQGQLKFRNCDVAFPKLRFTLRHCGLQMLQYKTARLLCIHSPPERSEKLTVNSEKLTVKTFQLSKLSNFQNFLNFQNFQNFQNF